MEKKIEGKGFHFKLNDDGLVECSELGVIADTFSVCFDLAKQKFAEIRKQTKINKGAIAIIDTWGKLEQCTVGIEDAGKVWIITASGSRSKENKKKIFVFDKSVLDEVEKIKAEIEKLEKREEEVTSRLVPFFKG